MSCTPKPNGFADHYPVFKWLAIIGGLNPIFRHTHIPRVAFRQIQQFPARGAAATRLHRADALAPGALGGEAAAESDGAWRCGPFLDELGGFSH